MHIPVPKHMRAEMEEAEGEGLGREDGGGREERQRKARRIRRREEREEEKVTVAQSLP